MASAMYQQAQRDLLLFARVRRVLPILWLFVVVALSVSAIRAIRAHQVASSYRIGADRALELLTMKHSEQLGMSFPGHEWVFVDCVNSAVADFLAALVVGALGLGARRAGTRRHALLVSYLKEEDARLGAG